MVTQCDDRHLAAWQAQGPQHIALQDDGVGADRQHEAGVAVAVLQFDLIGQKLAKENAAANRDLQSVMRVFQNNVNTELLARVRAVMRDEGYDV